MLPGRRLALAVFVAAAGLVGVLVMACGLTLTGESDGPADAREAAVLPPGTSEPEPPRPDAGPPGDGGDAAAHVSPCPADAGLAGPPMVESPAGDFRIDSTEVTVAQYRAFLADAGAPSIQTKVPPECLPLPASFDPVPALPAADAGKESRAVAGVSFCDAVVYCRWAGKRVCGGALATDAGTAGEWFRACTNDGRSGDPDGGACWLGQPGASGPQDVASKPGCEGGYGGVFDLLGNVAEWVDSCSGGNCTRAGGFWPNPPSIGCTQQEPVGITNKNNAVGIRCCR